MIFKQRGIIDPWTLGFLISLSGLTVAQVWEDESKAVSELSSKERIDVVIMNNESKPLQK